MHLIFWASAAALLVKDIGESIKRLVRMVQETSSELVVTANARALPSDGSLRRSYYGGTNNEEQIRCHTDKNQNNSGGMDGMFQYFISNECHGIKVKV